MEFAKSTSRWLGISDLFVAALMLAHLSATANILSATRLPTTNTMQCMAVSGPWFCAPALRLVCLFEDEDAAGPLVCVRYASPHVGQAFEPDGRQVLSGQKT
jgi:hypothetical protein